MLTLVPVRQAIGFAEFYACRIDMTVRMRAQMGVEIDEYVPSAADTLSFTEHKFIVLKAPFY